MPLDTIWANEIEQSRKGSKLMLTSHEPFYFPPFFCLEYGCDIGARAAIC